MSQAFPNQRNMNVSLKQYSNFKIAETQEGPFPENDQKARQTTYHLTAACSAPPQNISI